MPDPEAAIGHGNIYFLTDAERKAVLWAIEKGLAYDDGFAFPRDQNRVLLRSARNRLTFPHSSFPGRSSSVGTQ